MSTTNSKLKEKDPASRGEVDNEMVALEDILEVNRVIVESRLTEIERVLNLHPISITKQVKL